MNTITQILPLLAGVIGNGPQWVARCPAHQDRSPSLSIRDAGDKVLLHCHAGCEPEAILEALGLDWSDVCGGDRWQHAEHAGIQRAAWKARQEATKRKLALAFDPEQERAVLRIIRDWIDQDRTLSAEDCARAELAHQRLSAIQGHAA